MNDESGGDLELDMHVFPTMGRGHVMRRDCWCGPVVDPETLDKTQYIGSIWVHRQEEPASIPPPPEKA